LLLDLGCLTDQRENLWIEKDVLKAVAKASFSEQRIASGFGLASSPGADLRQRADWMPVKTGGKFV